MTLDDGSRIEASKNYRVAGWARVGSKAPGPPIWDVVAAYLRDRKTARIDRLNTPRLKDIGPNRGLADYPDMI